MRNDTLTAIPGIRVGHRTDLEAATGCTVILCETGAVAAIDVRGAAPGTRETDLLRPGSLVERIHAVVLTGGSAFGLDVACGAMRWLEERGFGFATVAGVVPIVPAMVLFDLQIGRPDVRPSAEWGYHAAETASTDPVAQGCVGVGTGCTVGKITGFEHATKAGLGSWCEAGPDGLLVAALVATNARGNIVDPRTGRVVAGARLASGSGFADAEALLAAGQARRRLDSPNTTLAVIATNATLNREQVQRVAQVAHDGMAHAIRPVHTMLDGDAILALSLPSVDAPATDADRVGAVAVRALEQAVLRSVTEAITLAGIPAARDLEPASAPTAISK